MPNKSHSLLSVEHSTYLQKSLKSFLQNFIIQGCMVEPRYNDPRYLFNDIPGITINMLCPGKSYSKMYGTEPRYNDIPDITMSF